MQKHVLYSDAPSWWEGAIVGIPLRIGERVVGVMNVAWNQPRRIPDRELHLLGLLADHAAIAIENARLHDLVAHQARTDSLTCLPNRRALDERIRSEVRRATRYGNSFALLMMDLDGFKRINDRYGHPVGDRVLYEIGALLQKATRGSDFLARYGGDEFALLLPEADLDHAQEVAQKLTRLVTDYSFTVDGEVDSSLSVSVGISTYPEDARTGDTLMDLADRALYSVKRSMPGTFATSALTAPLR
jgi:diguanylate cyclase (GGDEF)-like protein